MASAWPLLTSAPSVTEERRYGRRSARDLGVAQVDLGALSAAFCHAFGHGGVVFLAADGLLVDQLLVAVGDRLGRTQVGLGAFQGGFVDGGSIWYSCWPSLTSLPSLNRRLRMMPLTCGRTSAMR
jgi:hypothetical protein